MKKENNKKNKFKLVKYKRKLVPIVFGSFIVSASTALQIVSHIKNNENESSIRLKNYFSSSAIKEKPGEIINSGLSWGELADRSAERTRLRAALKKLIIKEITEKVLRDLSFKVIVGRITYDSIILQKVYLQQKIREFVLQRWRATQQRYFYRWDGAKYAADMIDGIVIWFDNSNNERFKKINSPIRLPMTIFVGYHEIDLHGHGVQFTITKEMQYSKEDGLKDAWGFIISDSEIGALLTVNDKKLYNNQMLKNSTIVARFKRSLKGLIWKKMLGQLSKKTKSKKIIDWVKGRLESARNLIELSEGTISGRNSWDTGILKVKINWSAIWRSGKWASTRNIEGFMTDSRKVREWMASISGKEVKANLSDAAKRKSPNKITTNEIYDAIKKLSSYKRLTGTQKPRFSASNIRISKATTEGMEVQLHGRGTTLKTLYMTIVSNHDKAKQIILKAIKATDEKELNEINFNKKLAASSQANTSSATKVAVFNKIKEKIDSIDGYSKEQKDLARGMTNARNIDVTFTPDDTKSELKIKIDASAKFNGNPKTITITGFSSEEQALKKWIKSLTAKELTEALPTSFKEKIPHSTSAKDAFNFIKSLKSFSKLTAYQRGLLKESHVSVSWNKDGTLTFSISYKGESNNIPVKTISFEDKIKSLIRKATLAINEEKLLKIFDTNKKADEQLTNDNLEKIRQLIIKEITHWNSNIRTTAQNLISTKDMAIQNYKPDELLIIINTKDVGGVLVNVEIKGFLNDKKAVENWIKSLDESKLQNALPDNIKGNIPHKTGQKAVFDFILTLDSFDQLTSDQKALVTQAVVKQINWFKDGTLKIEFEFEDASKIINLKVKSLKEAADELILKVVKEIAKEKLDEIEFKKDKQASAQENISSNIKNAIIIKIKEAIDDADTHPFIKDSAKAFTHRSNLPITFTHDDETGELKININPSIFDKNAPTRVVTIAGFLTNKEIADQNAVEKWVQSLDSTRVKGALSVELQKSTVNRIKPKVLYDTLTRLPSFTNLTPDQKLLFKEENVNIKSTNDPEGTRTFIISGHGNVKKVEIKVEFLEEKAKAWALKVINELNADNLNEIFNQTVQSSDGQNLADDKKESIVENIKELMNSDQQEKDVVKVAKELITKDLITLHPDDVEGVMSVDIDVKNLGGDETNKTLEITGFVTNNTIFKNFVNNLIDSDFENLLSDDEKNKPANEFTEQDILGKITKMARYGLLKPQHQELLTAEKIGIKESGKENILEFSISNNGEEIKTFEVKLNKQVNQTEEPMISSPVVEKKIENIEVDKEEKDDSGLSTTTIILIVVGSLLSIGWVGGLTYFIKKRKGKTF